MPEKSPAPVSGFHVRPAQAGDLCILLAPADPVEIGRLLQHQQTLQAHFGGDLIEPVHLTCQRFECQDQELMRLLIQKSRRSLAALAPFPLVARALQPLYVPILGANVLKWRIEVTGELLHLERMIRQLLQAEGITPLFRSTSTLVSALKGVPQVTTRTLQDYGPVSYPLFTAGRILWSRIGGVDQFETLATQYL